MRLRSVAVLTVVGVAVLPGAARAAQSAPGAPGLAANWTPGNKEGFGTSTTEAGTAWFTLAGAELSEVYAPDLGTPSLRDLQFVVSDGATFTERETDAAVQQTELASGTFSATPLGWTHAQLIRLAWSLDTGRPVEQPAIVACRYAQECR